jgi:hypothetical protein
VLNSPPQTIVDLSSLTDVQVETLKLHLAVRKSEIRMKDALKTRKNGGISRGTHYRILAQARRNIRESLFTVAIASQMGLLNPEDVSKLVSSVSMLPAEVNPEKLPQILSLMEALANRIVMS